MIEQETRALLESYRAAFGRRDAAAIADHYAYPAHLTSDIDEVVLIPLASRAEWLPRIEELLEMYAAVGFASAAIERLVVIPLSPLLAQAIVGWALLDAGGDRIFGFDTVYTVGRLFEGARITAALSPNEFSRYRECLGQRGVR